MKALSPLAGLPSGETQRSPLSNCDLAQRLLDSYKADGVHCQTQRALPSPPEIAKILELLRELLLPGSTGAQQPAAVVMHSFIESRLAELRVRLVQQLFRGLHHRCPAPHADCPACEARASEQTGLFLNQLPELRRHILLDVIAAYDGDPAATGLDEVVFSYPGVRAITIYRIAHALWTLGALIVPRMMTELAHAETGIDIHPGAAIGERFFIDHGTGVVIGETTVIGDRVRIYQGVTLGAMSLPTGTARKKQGQKRHPTIEDEVIIYANATILGGDTIIGRGAVIGGNAFVTHSVSPGAHVANPCR
jgi:serine O-acetyltransferase